MIELSEARKLARKIGISPEIVLMESYQMVILNALSEKQISKNLIFKGGTCLKLAYNSFRFSEDLDFSLLKPTSFVIFKKSVFSLVKSYPEMKIGEVFNMKKTFFARLLISIYNYHISIKIEVSKRQEDWKKNGDYQLKLLNSAMSIFQPYLKVSTLERIYQDKLKAVKTRKKPRDWFDLWFLSQKLNKPFDKKIRLSKRLMEDRVRFLLPQSKRLILKEFIYEN